MRKTEQAEIDVVKTRLGVFDGAIKQELVEQLLTPTNRFEQHRLFYLVLDDRTFGVVEKAMAVLKKYGHQPYIDRAVKIIQHSQDPVQYSANVAEIITAAYYIEKFGYENGKVDWERTVSESGNSVDITINGYEKPINIEVTGLTEPKEIRDFYQDHTTLRFKLRELVINNEDPQYCYLITFPDVGFVDIKNAGFLKEFIEKHLEAFAEFIKEQRANGKGEYTFTATDGTKAQVKMVALNKAKKEYVECAFGWSGQINDSFRIRSKVIEKARKQLPADEINFVYVANLAMLEDDDYLEAMFGQLQVVVNSADPSNHRTQYADNGISSAIEEESLAPVYGLIKSPFNYFENQSRKVIGNNRTDVGDDVLELIA